MSVFLPTECCVSCAFTYTLKARTQTASIDPHTFFDCSLNTTTPRVFLTPFPTSLSSHSAPQSCGPPLPFPLASGTAEHSRAKSAYSHGVESVFFPLLPGWYDLFCFLKELTRPHNALIFKCECNRLRCSFQGQF